MGNKPIYLYIAPFTPYDKSWRGGFFIDAAKALIKDGRYDVRVLSLSRFAADYEYEGIKIHRLTWVHIGGAAYFRTLLNWLNRRILKRRLMEIGVDVKDVAVCHVNDYSFFAHYALAFKKWNPNCFTILHHHYNGNYNLKIGSLGIVPIWSHLLYLRMRYEFEHADAHVFISNLCKSNYCKAVPFDEGGIGTPLNETLPAGKWFRRIELKASYVLYNGIDKEIFNQGDCGARQKSGFVIGCVGNYNPCKSQIDLIKAAEILKNRIPGLKVRLVGTGMNIGICKDYVAKHSLAEIVEFVPEMPHEKLPVFYRELDLFVMPSVNEGFCCVNAEANYCGVPAIACKGLPFEELLDETDKERWLAAPHNVQDFAERIYSFYEHRWNQKLMVDLDSNLLIGKFLSWIDAKRQQVRV